MNIRDSYDKDIECSKDFNDVKGFMDVQNIENTMDIKDIKKYQGYQGYQRDMEYKVYK